MGTTKSKFTTKQDFMFSVIKFLPMDIVKIIMEYDYNFEGIVCNTLSGHNKLIKHVSYFFPEHSNKKCNNEYKIISSDAFSILKIWDSNGICEKTIDLGEYKNFIFQENSIATICYAPANDSIICMRNKSIVVWKSKEENKLFKHSDRIRDFVIISHEGKNKLISYGFDCRINIWDLDSGKCELVLNQNKTVWCLSVLSNDKIICGLPNNIMRILDVTTGKCIMELTDQYDNDRTIECIVNKKINNNDTSYRVIGATHKRIKIWIVDLDSGLSSLERIIDCSNEITRGTIFLIYGIVLLPDGRIVSYGLDDDLRVWNSITGKCENVLSGHKGSVTEVCSLPDGRIASCSCDGTIKIWK
jgi:WD40 repeat protein